MKGKASLFVTAAFMLLICLRGFPQGTGNVSISRATEQIILTTTMQSVEAFSRYMELYAAETDEELGDIYKAELLKLVEKDSIYVYNDLIPVEDRAAEFEQNLDVFLTYLDDMHSRYLEGLSMVYNNFDTSLVFNDTVRNRLFVKITADRKIEGKYQYKNTSKDNAGLEKIDFYVGIILEETGIPKSKIYLISIHQNNERGFVPVKVVEKSTPIEFARFQWEKGLKRGKEYNLKWEGGEIYERLRLDLYRGSRTSRRYQITIDSTFFNDNSVNFTLPEKTRVGDDYFFRMTKLDSEEDPFDTKNFQVRRKYPLLMKAAIPAVLGVGIYAIFQFAQPKPEPDLPESPGLP